MGSPVEKLVFRHCQTVSTKLDRYQFQCLPYLDRLKDLYDLKLTTFPVRRHPAYHAEVQSVHTTD